MTKKHLQQRLFEIKHRKAIDWVNGLGGYIKGLILVFILLASIFSGRR